MSVSQSCQILAPSGLSRTLTVPERGSFFKKHPVKSPERFREESPGNRESPSRVELAAEIPDPVAASRSEGRVIREASHADLGQNARSALRFSNSNPATLAENCATGDAKALS